MNRLDHYTSFGLQIVEFELDQQARERMVNEVLVAVCEQALDVQIPTLVALIRDNPYQADMISEYVSQQVQVAYDKVENAMQDELAAWQASKPEHDDFRAGTLELALKNNTVTVVEALLFCGATDSLLSVVRPFASERDELVVVLLYNELTNDAGN